MIEIDVYCQERADHFSVRTYRDLVSHHYLIHTFLPKENFVLWRDRFFWYN